MNNLIKFIRTSANTTQDDFALKLGTTNITVNRWENAKSIPNKIAQLQIYNFCKDRNIDVFQYLLTSYSKEDNVLFHGSRNGIIGKIKPTSRSKCDFGKGFYMGTNPLQPLTLICNENHPVMYTVRIDTSKLNILDVPSGLDWAMLIAYYRGYMDDVKDTQIYKKYANYAYGYDIINGLIADDRMYSVLTDFFEGVITDAALIECLSALDLGKQYVAVTQKACDNIEIISKKELSVLEMLLLQDISITRRNKGIALAQEARLKHRRDGIYFDEILKGGI